MKLRTLVLLAVPLALGLGSAAAHADPWKDESGHRHHHRHYKDRDYKDTYWDGHCRIERKWKGNGDYKEERKCYDRPSRHYHRGYPEVVFYPEDPTIVISPRIVIRP